MSKRNVYFIRQSKSGPIKIGVTSGDPRARLKALQTGSPETLHLIGCMRGEERMVHDKFRAHMISGEWFRPTEDLLKFIALNAKPLARTATRMKGESISVATRISEKAAKHIEARRQEVARITGFKPSMSAVLRAIVDEMKDIP